MHRSSISRAVIRNSLGLMLVGLTAVSASSQEILQPVGVTSTMSGFPTSPLVRMIDQSSLRANYQSGVTNFDSFVASTSHANSNRESAVTVFEVGGLFTVDLGQTRRIDAVHLWGLRTFSTTLTAFSLFGDDDGDFANGTSASMGAFTGALDLPGTTFTFDPVDVRFVHIQVTENGGSNVVKIAEAAFRQARTAPFLATVPPGDPASGQANAVPFGTGSRSSELANVRYQTLVTRSQLGGNPVSLAGLRFVPAGTGLRRFDRLTVRIDHTTATSLTEVFDANLPAGSGQVVLDVRDHVWHHVADVFNDIGLQAPFAYNGTDNLIVEIVTEGAVFEASGTGPTSSSFRRGALPRLAVRGHDGTQTVGSLDSGGQRMQFHFADASTARFGEGCVGSRGLAPSLDFTGEPVVGTSLAVDLADAQRQVPAILVLGLDNTLPNSPLDLGLLGAPGCLLYHDARVTLPSLTDGSGAATMPVPLASNLPLSVRFYCQWVVLDAGANRLGLATSNYGRVVVGF